MAGSIGNIFKVTVFGESHGQGIGAVIDGCPAGLEITLDDIQKEMDKRRPQKASFSTARAEEDKVQIFSGISNNCTTGAPICLMVMNRDADSSAYEKIKDTPRPGHADYTAYIKYGGFSDYRGGGRFSGRITAGFVMAGAVARKLLSTIGVEILAHTVTIGGTRAGNKTVTEIRENVHQSLLRCADPKAEAQMTALIQKAREEGDSLGGVIEGIALNVPAGLGEPVFDTIEGEIAKALFAIPAVKGVEFGAGFEAAGKKGSENNDSYVLNDGEIITRTNNAGGILGGITSGMPIVVRVAVKPTPSISRPQQTVNLKTMKETTLMIEGRHDACIVPRAVVVVESMMAITLADLALKAQIIPEVIK